MSSKKNYSEFIRWSSGATSVVGLESLLAIGSMEYQSGLLIASALFFCISVPSSIFLFIVPTLKNWKTEENLPFIVHATCIITYLPITILGATFYVANFSLCLAVLLLALSLFLLQSGRKRLHNLIRVLENSKTT